MFRSVEEVKGRIDLLSGKILAAFNLLTNSSDECKDTRLASSELMTRLTSHTIELVEALEAMTWLDIDTNDWTLFNTLADSCNELLSYLSCGMPKIESSYPKTVVIPYKESIGLLQETICDLNMIQELSK